MMIYVWGVTLKINDKGPYLTYVAAYTKQMVFDLIKYMYPESTVNTTSIVEPLDLTKPTNEFTDVFVLHVYREAHTDGYFSCGLMGTAGSLNAIRDKVLASSFVPLNPRRAKIDTLLV